MQNHTEAFLLAMASSTDNFAVGCSLGVRAHIRNDNDKAHSYWFAKTNLVIAVCNAGGAYLAASLGSSVLHLDSLLSLAPLVSSTAFLYLACAEVLEGRKSSKNRTKEKPHPNDSNNSSLPSTLALALPMTLNNLAGGFVGGVAGITSRVAFLHVFFASLVCMMCGHVLGTRIRQRQAQRVDRDDKSVSSGYQLSAGLYGLLSLLTLHEALSTMS